MRYTVECTGKRFEVELPPAADGDLPARVVLDGRERQLDRVVLGDGSVALVLDGVPATLHLRERNGELLVHDGRRELVLRVLTEQERLAEELLGRGPGRSARGGEVRAVMPGVVRAVVVAEGQPVEPGQPLLILEAMKMENEIRSEHAGVVRRLCVAAGQAVEAGAVLLEIGPPAGGASSSP